MFKLDFQIVGDAVLGKMRRETRTVGSEPMKPHGDAAQLAVNAGNIFFSQKSDL